MPSKYWDRFQYEALNRTDLTANEIEAIKQNVERGRKAEEARVLQTAQNDEGRVDGLRTEHEEKAHEFLTGLQEKIKQAKARRLPAKEIIALREELLAFLVYYEGDSKRPGLIATLENGYARAAKIREDPGAYADEFYRKWPTLAATRSNLR